MKPRRRKSAKDIQIAMLQASLRASRAMARKTQRELDALRHQVGMLTWKA